MQRNAHFKRIVDALGFGLTSQAHNHVTADKCLGWIWKYVFPILIFVSFEFLSLVNLFSYFLFF